VKALVRTSWVVWLAIVATPAVALACPFCASNRQSPGVSALVLGIIVLPFFVVGAVLRVVLRTARDSDGPTALTVPSLEER